MRRARYSRLTSRSASFIRGFALGLLTRSRAPLRRRPSVRVARSLRSLGERALAVGADHRLWQPWVAIRDAVAKQMVVARLRARTGRPNGSPTCSRRLLGRRGEHLFELLSENGFRVRSQSAAATSFVGVAGDHDRRQRAAAPCSSSSRSSPLIPGIRMSTIRAACVAAIALEKRLGRGEARARDADRAEQLGELVRTISSSSTTKARTAISARPRRTPAAARNENGAGRSGVSHTTPHLDERLRDGQAQTGPDGFVLWKDQQPRLVSGSMPWPSRRPTRTRRSSITSRPSAPSLMARVGHRTIALRRRLQYPAAPGSDPPSTGGTSSSVSVVACRSGAGRARRARTPGSAGAGRSPAGWRRRAARTCACGERSPGAGE